jgi:superfamily II DNA or RNA helicase
VGHYHRRSRLTCTDAFFGKDRTAADQGRNQVIAARIADAYRRKRCSLALTNRIEHRHQLATALKAHGVEPLVLHGGLPTTERDRVRAELSAPRSGPLAVLAIDKVASQGLDAPRLDPLFLASPISFKGRMIQQVGRIMRNIQANNKNLVEVHDYLDFEVPLLERIYHKLRRILARRSFTLKDQTQPPTSRSQTPELFTPSSPKPTTAQVRAWDQDHGINVPARGRLRQEIWKAYNTANP